MKLPVDRTSRLRIKAKSSASLESFYADLATSAGWGHEMLDLVRHIGETGLSKRLYAFTSHADLFISIYPEIDRYKEVLRVIFNASTNTYDFEYYSKPTLQPEVSRSYPREVGIDKFSSFIEHLRW